MSSLSPKSQVRNRSWVYLIPKSKIYCRHEFINVIIFPGLSIDGSVSRRTLYRVTPATCSAHSRVWARAWAMRMPIITHLTSRRGEYSGNNGEIFTKMTYHTSFMDMHLSLGYRIGYWWWTMSSILVLVLPWCWMWTEGKLPAETGARHWELSECCEWPAAWAEQQLRVTGTVLGAGCPLQGGCTTQHTSTEHTRKISKNNIPAGRTSSREELLLPLMGCSCEGVKIRVM